MPGPRHEAVVELLHRHPRLLQVLLRQHAGVAVPGGPVREVDSNLSARRPLSFFAENVFLIEADAPAGGRRKKPGHRLLVVVEVQGSGPSTSKRRDWAAYLAIGGREYKCEAVVLVIALDAGVARRSRRPFRIGPGNTLQVLVIGPDDDPPPSHDPGLGPELIVLAAVTGALDLDAPAARVTVLDAISGAAAQDRGDYARLILALASEEARAALEDLMRTVYKETLVDRLLAQGKAEGRAEGEASLLLRALAARGLDVPAEVHTMVMSCTDTAQIEAWFDKTATAASVADVFGEQLPDPAGES